MNSPPPQQQLRTGAEAPGQSSAGKVTVLGLDRIKEQLAARWDKVSPSVHRFFESALERQMRPGDTFYKVDELAYVVLFRDLSQDGARIKCLAVAQDVCRRLFGEDTGDVSIKSVVGQMDDAALLQDVDVAAVIAAMLEQSGEETIVSEGIPAAKPEQQRTPAESPNTSERLLHLAFGPGFERPLPVPLEKIGFVYRPVWDAFRQVVLMYLCQPLPPKGEAVLCMAPHHDADRLTLDLLALHHAAARIGGLRRAGVRLLVACPIHFSTIGRTQQWTEYARVFQRLPPEITRDLAFLVLGIDHGVPNTRIAQDVPKLATRCKAVFAVVDRREREIRRFAAAGFQAIGVELERPTNGERGLIEHINNTARDAASLGLESFVLGAGSTSTIVNAVGAGVRYVEGRAVWPAVSEPRHAFVHEMTDLYRDIVAL